MAGSYFCKKYHQNFRKLFYRLPLWIILSYLLWSYINFALQQSIIPQSLQDVSYILFPRGYNFHFIWIVSGLIISIWIFLHKLHRMENKKIWLDIFFYSITFSLIPLWMFLFFGDDFMGKTTQWFLAVKSLHSESQRNKFISVYPIWLFLSIISLIVVLSVRIIRHIKKIPSIWIAWFISLLIWLNIVFMFQQYPRYWVLAIWSITFDILQYFTVIVIMFLLLLSHKRKKQDQE